MLRGLAVSVGMWTLTTSAAWRLEGRVGGVGEGEVGEVGVQVAWGRGPGHVSGGRVRRGECGGQGADRT